MGVGGEDIKHAVSMRVLGWILIVLSVVEFGVGGAVYGFLTNVHLGAWWGAICSFIAGVCGAVSNNRSAVIAGLVFSIFSIIVSIAGAVVDGIASAVLKTEIGCVNTSNGQLWGSTKGKLYASYCSVGYASYVKTTSTDVAPDASKGLQYINYYYENHRNYYYNHHNNNNNGGYGSATFSYQCVCADNVACFGYDLATGQNCGTILTTYTSLLSASTAFLSILVVVSFIYSIFTCISCSNSTVAASPPAQVQMGAIVPGQVGVPVMYGGQPQYVPVVPQPQYVPVPQPMGYAPQMQMQVGYAPQQPM